MAWEGYQVGFTPTYESGDRPFRHEHKPRGVVVCILRRNVPSPRAVTLKNSMVTRM